MRPTPLFISSLKLGSAACAAALLLISCGPPVGSESSGTDGADTGASKTNASTTGSNSGGTGTGTSGGTGQVTDTGTRLPPAMGGTGGAGNPNECVGVTTFGNSCSPNVGWCNYAAPEIQNNCGGCHGAFRTLANVKADTGIKGRVNSNMPPNKPLPSGDISKLSTWIDCGYPL